MKKIAFYIFCMMTLFSCIQGSNDTFLDLNGNYVYKGDGDNCTIESKRVSYHNKIYSKVTDYVFDKNFILAEQKPDLSDFQLTYGSDLTDRFSDFKLYTHNPKILDSPFHRKLKGIVELDSDLYKSFMMEGANDDNSNNFRIGILLADRYLSENPLVKKIFKGQLNYWIINEQKGIFEGPLSKLEFLVKRQQIKVPESLRLRFER